MKKQEQTLYERIERWAATNGFKFIGIEADEAKLERLSDAYPFEVDARLLDQIMHDEGY